MQIRKRGAGMGCALGFGESCSYCVVCFFCSVVVVVVAVVGCWCCLLLVLLAVPRQPLAIVVVVAVVVVIIVSVAWVPISLPRGVTQNPARRLFLHQVSPWCPLGSLLSGHAAGFIC